MQPTQQTVVIQQMPPAQYVINKKSLNCQAISLGSGQIIMGILCMIFNIIGIAIASPAQYGGTGIWIGILFVITGPFGIAAGTRKMRGWYIAFMVLSIISACLTSGIITQASIGLVIDEFYDSYIDPNHDLKMFLHWAMIICAVLELIFAIWSSVICCMGVGCGRKSNSSTPGQTVVYQSGAHPMVQARQHAVIVNQGHQGPVVNTTAGQWMESPYEPLRAGYPAAPHYPGF